MGMEHRREEDCRTALKELVNPCNNRSFFEGGVLVRKVHPHRFGGLNPCPVCHAGVPEHNGQVRPEDYDSARDQVIQGEDQIKGG